MMTNQMLIHEESFMNEPPFIRAAYNVGTIIVFVGFVILMIVASLGLLVILVGPVLNLLMTGQPPYPSESAQLWLYVSIHVGLLLVLVGMITGLGGWFLGRVFYGLRKVI